MPDESQEVREVKRIFLMAMAAVLGIATTAQAGPVPEFMQGYLPEVDGNGYVMQYAPRDSGEFNLIVNYHDSTQDLRWMPMNGWKVVTVNPTDGKSYYQWSGNSLNVSLQAHRNSKDMIEAAFGHPAEVLYKALSEKGRWATEYSGLELAIDAVAKYGIGTWAAPIAQGVAVATGTHSYEPLRSGAAVVITSFNVLYHTEPCESGAKGCASSDWIAIGPNPDAVAVGEEFAHAAAKSQAKMFGINNANIAGMYHSDFDGMCGRPGTPACVLPPGPRKGLFGTRARFEVDGKAVVMSDVPHDVLINGIPVGAE
jgi:hypothetical protein